MVRHSSGLKTLSGTDATELWKVTINRSARLTKVIIYNPDSADHVVYLGSYDGATATQLLPGIKVLSGQTVTLAEDELPNIRVYSDSSTQYSWAGWLDAAVTANNVEISIEVDEE